MEVERKELEVTPRGGFQTLERVGLPLVKQGDSGRTGDGHAMCGMPVRPPTWAHGGGRCHMGRARGFISV